jgi:hypothetical protein
VGGGGGEQGAQDVRRGEVTGGCNEEFHNLWSLPSIFRMMKSRM